MPEEDEFHALREARLLVAEYGSEATLYAALKAKHAIESRDYRRCAKWKRVLEILASDNADTTTTNHS